VSESFFAVFHLPWVICYICFSWRSLVARGRTLKPRPRPRLSQPAVLKPVASSPVHTCTTQPLHLLWRLSPRCCRRHFALPAALPTPSCLNPPKILHLDRHLGAAPARRRLAGVLCAVAAPALHRARTFLHALPRSPNPSAEL